MFAKFSTAVVVAAATSGLVSAQTSTICDPTKKTCSPDPAFGEVVTCDFTKGKCPAFQAAQATDIKYEGKGAVFSIASENDAPTIHTGKYIFFGEIEVELEAAPGRGIVTSVVLQSDDLDEIDLEWIGSDKNQVQSNYFSKGDTKTYDRGAFHPVPGEITSSHTYKITWTKDAVTWSVNGNVVRTLTSAQAKGGSAFPQSPMQIKLGTWVGGSSKANEGTVQWAGGSADFNSNSGPYLCTYKKITITDYAGGDAPAKGGIKEYKYGDKSGSAKSIEVVKGESSADQVKGENGVKGGEGTDNGSSSHNESKSVLEEQASSEGPSSTSGSTSPTSGAASPTAGGDDGQGARPQTTLSSVTGGLNSTATARPTGDSGSPISTSAAGVVRRDTASFGALAVAAAVLVRLLL